MTAGLLDAHVEASRALQGGDALRALSLVGRVADGLGLLLRGVAYAQLGDLDAAKEALERAIAISDQTVTRGRARAALVEILLEEGDARRAADAASASARELEALGDARNAATQRLVQARAEVLLGRLAEARAIVDAVLEAELPADVRAVASLARAEIAMRALRATDAAAALQEAARALESSPHRLLSRALESMRGEVQQPLARIARGDGVETCDLFAIERATDGELFLVDACRRLAIAGRATVPLARRPILFSLLEQLARAHPRSVPRDDLAARAFDARKVNASHRARLRVEIGRLRKLLVDLAAEPIATDEGYALSSRRDVALLLPPGDHDEARVALLLGDGAWWSAQSVAEHAGVSKRTAQRALAAMVESGAAIRAGSGARVRYARPGTPIASRMLLLGLLPKT